MDLKLIEKAITRFVSNADDLFEPRIDYNPRIVRWVHLSKPGKKIHDFEFDISDIDVREPKAWVWGQVHPIKFWKGGPTRGLILIFTNGTKAYMGYELGKPFWSGDMKFEGAKEAYMESVSGCLRSCAETMKREADALISHADRLDKEITCPKRS